MDLSTKLGKEIPSRNLRWKMVRESRAGFGAKGESSSAFCYYKINERFLKALEAK